MCLECISGTSIKSEVPFRSCSKLNSYPLTGAVSTGQSIISEKQSTPNYTLNTDRECNKMKQPPWLPIYWESSNTMALINNISSG